MTVLKVLAVIAILITALLLLRLRVRIRYKDELELIVGASIFTFKILPKKKKKVDLRRYSLKNIRRRALEAEKPPKPKKEKKKKEPEKPSEKPEEEQKPKRKMTAEEVIELVNVLLEIVGGVFRKFGKYPRIDVRQLFIRVAGDDPANTAQLYGIVSQALVYLREIFLNVKNFHLHRETRVGVEADFMSDKMLVDVDIELTIKIWHLLSIAFGAALRFIKHIITSSGKGSDGGASKPKNSGQRRKTVAGKPDQTNKQNKKVQTINKTTGGGANV